MIEKLTAPIREFGIFAGFLYIVDRLLQRLSSETRLFVYELMVQPIPDEPYTGLRAIKSFEHRQIQRDDPELRAMPVPREVIEARFDQGAVCFGTFKRGRFVGYIWFAFGHYDEDEIRCTYVLSPAAESVFDFDLYIFPEFRLGLAFTAIWQGAIELLRTRGVRQSFSRLTRFNVASRRAHAHLGWALVGRAVTLRLWRIECVATTLSPYLSFSITRPLRLVLRADVLRRRSSAAGFSRES